MSRRTSLAVALATVLTAGPLAGCSVPGTNDPAEATGETTPPATAKVQRTDLTETLTETGQLGYGDPLDLPAGLTGTVTWLPTVGTVVENGEPSTGSTPTRCSGSTGRCPPGATSAPT